MSPYFCQSINSSLKLRDFEQEVWSLASVVAIGRHRHFFSPISLLHSLFALSPLSLFFFTFYLIFFPMLLGLGSFLFAILIIHFDNRMLYVGD